MATAPSTTAEVPDAGAPEPRAAGRRWLLPKLLVAALVAVVIAVECAVAYLCLPAASQTAAMAGGTGKAGGSKTPGQETAGAEADETPADVEVDMGEFCVTALQPTASMTLRIDFHLYGSVAAENEKEFKRLLEDNKHRLREQVLVTIRSADISDLTDASLGLVKRLILERARKTLGKPLLREVIISDYSFIEQ
jgi:flagellar FliL protein